MRLYIAEKPDVARALVEALGGNFQKHQGFYLDKKADAAVTFCVGHLLKLHDPEDYNSSYKTWRMEDLPLKLSPARYKPIEGTAQQLDIVLNLIRDAKEIVHAGDPDSEGQLLVDEVLDHAKVKVPVLRLLINDNNPKVIKKALANIRPNAEFAGLSNAARARSIADQIYGINLTRAYTLAIGDRSYGGVWSVGRVQTPVLGLIVRRDRAHEAHEKRSYHSVSATFPQLPGVLARLEISTGMPLDEEQRICDESFAQSISKACKGQPATILALETKKEIEPAPLPHNLLSLQAEAFDLYKIKPDETLTITQRLRERYRLITYNRSDCRYLSDEMHSDARETLKAIETLSPRLQAFLHLANADHKSRAFNSSKVSAHHAIVPTVCSSGVPELTVKERQIYELIALGFMAQFLLPAISEVTEIKIACNGYTYTARSQKILESGWKNARLQEQNHDHLTNDPSLAPLDLAGLDASMALSCSDIRIARNYTKAIPRYTHATLLTDLTRVSRYVSDPRIKALLLDKDKDKAGEHGGLGTPATRSDIVRILFSRGFLMDQKGSIVSTDAARKFYDALPDTAKLPDMTALWHEQQKAIESSELSVDDFLKGIEDHISQEIQGLKRDGVNLKLEQHKCPTCLTANLQRRRGPKGIFWGCLSYPSCKVTLDDKAGKPDFEAAASSKYKCIECGKGLRRIRTSGSNFWGCSGYPTCSKTYADNRGRPKITMNLNAPARRPQNASL